MTRIGASSLLASSGWPRAAPPGAASPPRPPRARSTADALPPSLLEPTTTTTTPTESRRPQPAVELFLVVVEGDAEKLASVDADIVNVVDHGRPARARSSSC